MPEPLYDPSMSAVVSLHLWVCSGKRKATVDVEQAVLKVSLCDNHNQSLTFSLASSQWSTLHKHQHRSQDTSPKLKSVSPILQPTKHKIPGYLEIHSVSPLSCPSARQCYCTWSTHLQGHRPMTGAVVRGDTVKDTIHYVWMNSRKG